MKDDSAIANVFGQEVYFEAQSQQRRRATAGVDHRQQMLGNSSLAGEVEIVTDCDQEMVSAEGIEPSTY